MTPSLKHSGQGAVCLSVCLCAVGREESGGLLHLAPVVSVCVVVLPWAPFIGDSAPDYRELFFFFL